MLVEHVGAAVPLEGRQEFTVVRDRHVAVAKLPGQHRDAHQRVPGELLAHDAGLLGGEQVAQRSFLVVREVQQRLGQDKVQVAPGRRHGQASGRRFALGQTLAPLVCRHVLEQPQRRTPRDRLLGQRVAGGEVDEFRVKRRRLGGIVRIGMELRDAREVVKCVQPGFVVGAGLADGFQQRAGLVDVALELGLGIEQQDTPGVGEGTALGVAAGRAVRGQPCQGVVHEQLDRLLPGALLPRVRGPG